MIRASTCVGLAGALALGACAVAPPSGPSFAALPGHGKSFEQFQVDDGSCRQYSSIQSGGNAPGQAAQQSGVVSAVGGTAIGAAAGALLGAVAGNAGAGAAIGAGSGLLLGGASGAGSSQDTADSTQHRYDIAYAQCMYAKGNQLPSAPTYVATPVYVPTPTYVVPGSYGYGYGY